MCSLQDRLRSVLQRSKCNAEPCPCGVVTAPLKRFRDDRGRKVTVVTSGRKKVTYLYDGDDRICALPPDKFYNKFKQVEV